LISVKAFETMVKYTEEKLEKALAKLLGQEWKT
jgi:hypothetical protein